MQRRVSPPEVKKDAPGQALENGLRSAPSLWREVAAAVG